ncbi:hypothetical protein B0H17DRAFT_1147411 [Mycena rosella]|uniref:Uncharacterized protein n=1 Tax=Mycena rosella TaxID=1033263 RepID=A0AAD7CLU1_MYCRO|nr:hypothetical protein B0H17DRAFT_1147411 [Mycena rosella]
MPVTRSSLPRNRSGATRSPLPALQVSPRTPSARTIARHTTMLARYVHQYPISTELGFVGLLADRRRNVNVRINEALAIARPRPPPSRHLDRRHQNHNLTGPQQNKGITSLQGIASWHQVPSDLREGPLRRLLKAREELYPRRRQPLTNEDAAAAATALAAARSRCCAQPHEAEHLNAPLTPTDDGLHYDYRHYSPNGYIILSTPSSQIDGSDSDSNIFAPSEIPEDLDLDLQYPPDVLDLCAPVLLLAWLDATTPPIHMMVHPRAAYSSEAAVCIGEVVLNDFRAALQLRGLPAGAEIERFLDTTDHWLRFPWSTGIPVYGRNKVIYIRLAGVDVIPPDHFAELLPNLIFD